MSQLRFQGVSHDLQYVFTNKGVTRISDQLNDLNGKNYLPYTYGNLNIAVDIMRENSNFKYRTGQIDLVEYSSESRKFLHQLTEIFQPDNTISILKEWEENFGSKLLLINESIDKLIIESRITESWNQIKVILNELDIMGSIGKGISNVADWGKETVGKAVDWTKQQGKEISQKGLGGWAADKVSSAWEGVKNAVSKAYKCLSNNFFECLMEGLREAAFSPVGMGVMTALTFIPGVGQVADAIVFGALLIWDVYKMFSGKYESGEYQVHWYDPLIDAVCLLLPYAGKLFKGAIGGVKSMAELGPMAAKQGGILAKGVNLLKGSLTKILDVIGQSAKWIGEKLGIKWLSEIGAKAKSFMTSSVGTVAKTTTNVKNVVKQGATSVATKLGTKSVPVVVKATGKTILINSTICAALGLDGFTCHAKVASGEIGEAEISKALSSKKTAEKLNQVSREEARALGLY
jgi:hypothetical protein